MTIQPNLINDSRMISLTLTEDSTGGKLILKGEMGRSGVPTENGRVYPREVWEKQIAILKRKLKSRAVLGTSDHPCLKDSNFKVLTEKGWKNFLDITEKDKVWSRKNGNAILSNVEAVINMPYEGDIYDVNYKTSLEVSFTPEHKFLLLKRPEHYNNKEIYVTAKEIYNNRSKYSHDAIPRSADFIVSKSKPVVIKGIKDASNRFKNDITRDLILDPKIFAAFMGIYLAEGSTSNNKHAAKGSHLVSIAQKIPWSKQYIFDNVLSKLHPELEWMETDSGYSCSDRRLRDYLTVLGNKYTKFVPDEVKVLDQECLREFLFWYTIGDGRISENSQSDSEYTVWKSGAKDITYKHFIAEQTRYNDDASARWSLSTVSEKLVYDLLECVIKTGKTGVISKEITKKDYHIEGRLIKVENKVPLFTLKIFKHSGNINMHPKSFKIERNYYKGNIYCLKTTHGNFLMEKNGVSFWTGNSDGKTSLKEVSHVLTDLYVNDDGIVIGTAEILPTTEGKNLEAIIRAGCPIGVSSRGFGTTMKNERGEDVVQSDFQLITFDFVADPADPTAYPVVIAEGKEFKTKHIFEGKELVMETTTKEDQKDRELAAKWAKMLDDEMAEKDEEKDPEEVKEDIMRKLSQIQIEMKDHVRKEVLSDPEIVKAKEVFESIKGVFGTPSSLQESVDKSKDTKIEALTKEIEAKDRAIAALKEDINQAGKLIKRLGFQTVLENSLKGFEDADIVISTIGDVTKFESITELNESVNFLKGKLTSRKNQQKKLLEQKEKMLAAERQNEAKLHTHINTLTESLNKMMEAYNSQSLMLKAVDKLAGNPDARYIMSLIESANVKSEAEIDSIIKKASKRAYSVEDIDAVKARARVASKGALNNLPAYEEKSHKKAQQVVNEDIGASVAEFNSLIAGVK